ncbi:LysR family transcriptional regulator [Acinetobacter ursingii]|uniref:LysR family transcriptional regulator n=1 Tax=Acinetobacter ursingii TaxID=108980 RepID=UPI00124D8E0C|nr:LysR family transcriptional regulator [Acinetobacter ursingii]MCU4307200.1 LysR family transcriptional regulator [Acinetobacter ursingii]MCU4373142.1 LysR family transcriptional regulator [Acinetobacter ursingii]MDG9993153.1 LysR family transcriptional regulator [Acinetobacter ursingii]MDH0205447.1 LysR family transcriptional regulator [Acinetobacter ursingii]
MLENLNDLKAFILVANTGSFTKAAAQLGVSQSALSHTIKSLENQLNLRLLHRTTRSVSTTAAGEELLQKVEPLLSQINAEINTITQFRNTLAGTFRIHATDHAIYYILWPRLVPILQQYPEIKVEINMDYRFTDIVAERYDMGVRIGIHIDKDMISQRISPDFKMTVVASPEYFAKHPAPKTPDDLAMHNCINMRLPTKGGILGWDFINADGQRFEKHVDGQLIVNQVSMLIKAATDHMGVIWVQEDRIQDELKAKKLVKVLEDWAVSYEGYHLYYPNRQESNPIFRLFVDALKQERSVN